MAFSTRGDSVTDILYWNSSLSLATLQRGRKMNKNISAHFLLHSMWRLKFLDLTDLNIILLNLLSAVMPPAWGKKCRKTPNNCSHQDRRLTWRLAQFLEKERLKKEEKKRKKKTSETTWGFCFVFLKAKTKNVPHTCQSHL